jgi:DNA-binding CsgD family transcriptional regulator
MVRSDFTDLVVPLHEGVHEATPWAVFLERLRQRARADAVAIDVRPADGGPVIRFGSGAMAATWGGAWQGTLRPGRVYALDECKAEAPGFGRIVRVEDSGGASAWLSIWRGQRDFSAADGAVLSGLAPHLTIAVRTREALDRHVLRDAGATTALTRADVGWVALAHDARVLAVSPIAAEMFGDGVGQRLAARRGAGLVSREAAAAIADFCHAPGGALAVVLDGAEPAAMLLVPAARAESAGTVTPAAAIGLVVTRPNGDLAGRAAALAALHGLAPSEARFAAAIGSGASLATAAAALGLTIETARNYSKRVYAKTHATGQVDLVRMVGESVVRLG